MPRAALLELPQKTQDILADLPPWYSEDEIARAIVNAGANELQRIEDFLVEVRRQMHPEHADDTYGILGMWEDLFRLPVEPVDVLVEDRRALVLAHFRKRAAGGGTDWEDSVSESLHTFDWTYEEGPAAYTITVHFPYASGGYTTSQALVLIRQVTPAHLDLAIGYSEGWLVGISGVGDVL